MSKIRKVKDVIKKIDDDFGVSIDFANEIKSVEEAWKLYDFIDMDESLRYLNIVSITKA